MSDTESTTANLATPLSEPEFDELDQFLLSDALPADSMVLSELDGYLTALVIGPALVPPNVWLPKVWANDDDQSPVFNDMAQAQRVLTLMTRHMNGIAATFERAPDTFKPLFDINTYPGDDHAYVDGEIWAHGFMAGIAIAGDAWLPLLSEPALMQTFQPLRLLGANDLDAADEKLVATPAQRETLTLSIPASLVTLYQHALARNTTQAVN
ncbi:MAG TPA: YecA family protein [Rhodanobacteraceae bacterium]